MQTPDGRVVGTHPGVFHFTLGQREGLQIGGLRGFEASPWYVVGQNVERNVLVVDQGSDSRYLLSAPTWTQAAHRLPGAPPATKFPCPAPSRSRPPAPPCA